MPSQHVKGQRFTNIVGKKINKENKEKINMKEIKTNQHQNEHSILVHIANGHHNIDESIIRLPYKCSQFCFKHVHTIHIQDIPERNN